MIGIKDMTETEKTSVQNKKTGFWELKVWSTSAFASFYLDFWNSKISFNLEGRGFNPKTPPLGFASDHITS